MFFAPQRLQDSAQSFNPGKHPRKTARPERARDQVVQMPPIATEKGRGYLLGRDIISQWLKSCAPAQNGAIAAPR